MAFNIKMESNSNVIGAGSLPYPESVKTFFHRIVEYRQQLKAETLDSGGKWSLIQDFMIIPSFQREVYASTGDNFEGLLDSIGVMEMYKVYPRFIVEVLNCFYDTINSGYEFRISDIDSIITEAFPEHPGMISKGSFMELEIYNFVEVRRHLVKVLKTSYRSRFASATNLDED